MTTVIDKCREQTAQYVVVLNGIWYRMDASGDSPGGLSRLAPQEMPPPAAPGDETPPKRKASFAARSKAVRSSPAPYNVAGSQSFQSSQITVDDAMSQPREQAGKPFYRDGAEPLRAGHPDLWNLLVFGTSLEGTDFCTG